MSNEWDWSTEPTQAEYAAFGASVAAMLGASTVWEPEDFEAINELAMAHLRKPVGSFDAESFRFWRQRAVALHVFYNDDATNPSELYEEEE